MKWTSVQDYEAASRLAAQRMFDAISLNLERKGKVAVGLATGNTMIRLYALLAEKLNQSRLGLSDLSTFNLDEYVDGEGRNVPSEHPLSYRTYMDKHLFNLLDKELGLRRDNVFFPDAEAPAGFDDCIEAAGGLDIQLLGIGFNGHIAFNEPMPEDEIAASDFAALPSRVINLAEQTVLANARLTAAGERSVMPCRAVTMGMRSILNAREILLVACFQEQTAPLSRLKAGKVSTETPASFLLNHPAVEVIYTTDKIQLGGAQ